MPERRFVDTGSTRALSPLDNLFGQTGHMLVIVKQSPVVVIYCISG